ncbi:MAG: P-loop NTPase fold protein [Myxococcota bacterium]
MSSPTRPRFLIDLEVQDLHTVDHASLARSILRGIELAPPPFRIALFGPWGSGKSTILRMLQEQLLEHDNQGGVGEGVFLKTVWFNPWEHESNTNLMQSLVALLTVEIPDGIRYSRKGSRVIQKVALASDWIGQRWDERSIVVRDTRHTSAPELLNPDHDGELAQVSAMREAFRRFVDFTLVQGPKHQTRRLVVFIDDLDKCRPINVLNLLEGLKLAFSRKTNIILVFALDREVLCNAIEQKYGRRRDFDADKYIEKIFEFSYDVPAIAIRHIKPLIRELYERARLMELAGTEEQAQRDMEAISAVLGQPGIDLNPRKIKRVFNKFIWFFASRDALGLNAEQRPEPDPDPEMDQVVYWLTWLLTGECWREFRKLTNQYGESAVAELCNRVTGNPIYPHSNQQVRQEFDLLAGRESLLEYYRAVFNVGRGAHLPQIQELMKTRVTELARIDRILRLHGL